MWTILELLCRIISQHGMQQKQASTQMHFKEVNCTQPDQTCQQFKKVNVSDL